MLGLLFTHQVKAVSPSPLLGEIAWAGSNLSTADEWLELWNPTLEPISLAGYELSGASSHPIIFDAEDIIQANSVFLIANYDQTNIKSTLNIQPNDVTTDISLPNEKLFILLKDQPGNIVDQIESTGKNPAGSSSPKASMIRQADRSWLSATETKNLKEGIPDLGTPGFCDVCPLVPEAEVTPPVEILPPENTNQPEPISETNTSTEEIITASSTPEFVTDLPNETTSTTPLPDEINVEPIATTSSEDIIIPPSEELPTTNDATSTEAINEPLLEINSSSTTMTNTSSTEPIETQNTPTSSVDLIETNNQIATNSSTDIGETNTTTSTTVNQIETVSNTETTNNTSNQNASATNTPVTIITIQPRIIRALSNPSAGPEWIELHQISYAELTHLANWSLEDAVGTIFRFTPDQFIHVSTTNDGIHIELSKTYLNNGGDSIKLKDQNGQLMDEVTLPSLQKDAIWNRDAVVTTPSNTTTTSVTTTTTSEGTTEVPTPTVVVQGIPVPKTDTLSPIQTTSSTASSTTSTKTTTVTKPKATKTTTTKTKATTSTKATVTKPKATTTKTTAAKTTKPKTTTTKKVVADPAPQDISFDMLTRIEPQTRVRLTGTVGSLPGQVGAGYFIIHNPDGRGLLVKTNGTQAIPTLGSTIQISGKLTLTDTALYLKMEKLDNWQERQDATFTVSPRAVDFITPAEEDAWSLVDVTATVLKVSGSTIYLDVDGIDVQVKIKPMVRYRASRLKDGDVIRVRGLLDRKNDVPAIYPRSAEEILILSSATATLANPAITHSLPTWMPFGAAGATIAFTQGYKQLKKSREKRVLARAVGKIRQTKA